jgi:hypothetical protein
VVPRRSIRSGNAGHEQRHAGFDAREPEANYAAAAGEAERMQRRLQADGDRTVAAFEFIASALRAGAGRFVIIVFQSAARRVDCWLRNRTKAFTPSASSTCFVRRSTDRGLESRLGRRAARRFVGPTPVRGLRQSFNIATFPGPLSPSR